jgi:tryptophan synthase alpha chain
LNLKNPVLVGFGIKDKETFNQACTYGNGAIIGTAYIKALENCTDIRAKTQEFLGAIIQ